MRGFPRGITKVDDKTSADLKSDPAFEKALQKGSFWLGEEPTIDSAADDIYTARGL